MGKPMATNLINAGYPLIAYSRSNPDATARSPKELAAASDIIICVLPDAPQIREVAFGKDGLLEGLKPSSLFIDMSTTDVATELEIQRRFEAKGVDTLDAPVSGGQPGAVNGSLSIMVGGRKESFERALPIFQVLGKNINHMGGHGAGQITKSCNQIATALITQGIIEAFTLAASAGIDLTRLKEVMSGGFADSRALSITGDKIIRRDFNPGFKLELYRKDLNIARQAALERALEFPGTELLFREMDSLLQKGKGALDFSALIQVFEK
ncbi:MAG: NAD(P)-dependent oxidoreductase [Bacteroidetes bacterium]|nr:NAD(P)-dependent oxidoreductase [Bacteroidota bacterium]